MIYRCTLCKKEKLYLAKHGICGVCRDPRLKGKNPRDWLPLTVQLLPDDPNVERLPRNLGNFSQVTEWNKGSYPHLDSQE